MKLKVSARRLTSLYIYLLHPALLWRRLLNQARSEISVDELASLLPPAPTIIEAGAAGGEDTVRFAAQWPRGKIFAFEPVPRAFARLKRSVKGFSNVNVFEQAISVTNGQIELFVASAVNNPDATDSSSALAPNEQLSEWPDIMFNEKHLATAITLESIFERENIAHVDLLWLDMQGYELACLMASRNRLAHVGRIYMEVSFRRYYLGTPLYSEVKRKLRECGFKPEIEFLGSMGGNVLFKRV